MFISKTLSVSLHNLTFQILLRLLRSVFFQLTSSAGRDFTYYSIHFSNRLRQKLELASPRRSRLMANLRPQGKKEEMERNKSKLKTTMKRNRTAQNRKKSRYTPTTQSIKTSKPRISTVKSVTASSGYSKNVSWFSSFKWNCLFFGCSYGSKLVNQIVEAQRFAVECVALNNNK